MTSSPQAEFDESVYLQMAEFMIRAQNAGRTEEEIAGWISSAIGTATDKTAPTVAAALYRDASKMLRRHRRMQRGFQRRLRKHWGRALDIYYMAWVGMEELGSDFNERERLGAVERRDFVFDVVCGLHARACRTALEVYHLLAGGFPLGALSRCRTLHEIAVTAMVIGEHGRRPGREDLAERFLLHNVVTTYEDAQIYQTHAEALKQEPFTDAEIDIMRSSAADLLHNGLGRDTRICMDGPSLLPDRCQAFELSNNLPACLTCALTTSWHVTKFIQILRAGETMRLKEATLPLQ